MAGCQKCFKCQLTREGDQVLDGKCESCCQSCYCRLRRKEETQLTLFKNSLIIQTDQSIFIVRCQLQTQGFDVHFSISYLFMRSQFCLRRNPITKSLEVHDLQEVSGAPQRDSDILCYDEETNELFKQKQSASAADLSLLGPVYFNSVNKVHLAAGKSTLVAIPFYLQQPSGVPVELMK